MRGRGAAALRKVQELRRRALPRLLGAAGPVGAGLVVLLVLAACTGDRTGGPVAQPGEEPPAALRVGVSLPSYHYDPQAVGAWEVAAGHRADVVQTFVPWLYGESKDLTRFPAHRVREISGPGRVVEITWTPAEPAEGEGRPGIPLAEIADGEHDDYVRRFARDVRDSGLTIRLRFAHEMNGYWSRWSETNAVNHPGDYVRAWRHLHDVFKAEGATRVAWVWSPNIVGDQTQPLPELYPGDAYVDEIGIDGYSYPRSGCPGPRELFDPTLAQVRELSQVPVAIAEVGVSTDCRDRNVWVADLFGYARTSGLVGVTWWERTGGEEDFRIVDSPDTLAALREALHEPG